MSDIDLTINRRVAMQLMATAGAAISSPQLLQAAESKTMPPSTPVNSTTSKSALSGTRLNLEEAQRVMHDLKVDALVLGDGRSFQQATGFLPVLSKMGWPPSNFAIVVNEPEPRVLVVMSGFLFYYLAADVDAFSDNELFLYAGPNASELEQDAALNSIKFNDRDEADMSFVERNRISSTRQAIQKKALHNSVGHAVSAALKSANVSKGRLAYDNPGIAKVLTEFAPDAQLTSSDDALRRIRTVKSKLEIELMRQASKINIKAAHAAVEQIGPGATHQDLRRAFYSELAKRNANGIFMVIDRVSDERYQHELSNGQAFLIDCVGDYQGYLGDYGRTVFMGDVPKSVMRAQVAVGKAWDSLRAKLKPGLKFSEIRALGQKAMHEQGATYRVSFSPHSVGVFHTDHIGDGSSPRREDIVLRPGMIISIDCPVLETGIGGSVHLEDLMLITQDGAEPIHDIGQQAIYL